MEVTDDLESIFSRGGVKRGWEEINVRQYRKIFLSLHSSGSQVGEILPLRYNLVMSADLFFGGVQLASRGRNQECC